MGSSMTKTQGDNEERLVMLPCRGIFSRPCDEDGCFNLCTLVAQCTTVVQPQSAPVSNLSKVCLRETKRRPPSGLWFSRSKSRRLRRRRRHMEEKAQEEKKAQE